MSPQVLSDCLMLPHSGSMLTGDDVAGLPQEMTSPGVGQHRTFWRHTMCCYIRWMLLCSEGTKMSLICSRELSVRMLLFKTFVRYKCKCKKWQFCAEQLHTLPAICMRILTHVLLDKILPVGVWVRGVDRKDVRGDEIHPLVG